MGFTKSYYKNKEHAIYLSCNVLLWKISLTVITTLAKASVRATACVVLKPPQRCWNLPHQSHHEPREHRLQAFSSSQLIPLCTDFPCTKYAGFFQELAISETLQEQNLHDVECEDLQQLTPATNNQKTGNIEFLQHHINPFRKSAIIWQLHSK